MIKLLLLLLSGAKLGKLFASGGSMLLSVGAYALVFGWRYAAGFVALMFVHEMGHYLAARRRGLAVGLPTFIPFVGAWVQLKDLPHDAETDAYVGMAGPLLGTAASLACYVLARNENSDWLLAVAYAGLLLNLINLIPILPFDGGRITAVLSPRIWLLGVPAMAGLFWYSPSPMLILIALLAAPQVWKAIRFRRDDPQTADYYRVAPGIRWSYALCYLALVAFLALMVADLHEQIGTPGGAAAAVHPDRDAPEDQAPER
jgi:Zn-dependent protease